MEEPVVCGTLSQREEDDEELDVPFVQAQRSGDVEPASETEGGMLLVHVRLACMPSELNARCRCSVCALARKRALRHSCAPLPSQAQ